MKYITNDINLFRGPLKQILEISIQVNRGVLSSDQYSIAIVECKDSSSTLLKALFILRLRVNLVSTKYLYKNGLKGYFNEIDIYFKKGNEVIVHI